MTLKTIRTGVVIALAGLAFAGCDEPGASPYEQPLGDWVSEDGRINFRLGVDNAQQVNSTAMNGRALNGRALNGQEVNGRALNGRALNGHEIGNLVMVNNKLTAQDGQGNSVAGSALEDLRLTFTVQGEDASVVEVEESVTEIEEAANGLIVAALKQRVLPGGGWVNSCANGAKAVQLKGDWDPVTGVRTSSASEMLTWSCLGAALGDCAAWGFVPGKVVSGQDLGAFHQACTRAKRADYCGNGVSRTQNGTSIDIYDRLGVQVVATNWPIEALYGEDGAICLNHTRKTNYTKDPNDNSKTYIGCNIPACVDVNSDGKVDFDDYPTAKIAIRNVATDPV